jgi:hypothetical protein
LTKKVRYIERSQLLQGTFEAIASEEQLAYFESHILHATVARIKGLIKLLSFCNDNERLEILAKLQLQIDDLRQIVVFLKRNLSSDNDAM